MAWRSSSDDPDHSLLHVALDRPDLSHLSLLEREPPATTDEVNWTTGRCNSRSDVRYEFSLAPNPDFDTDSIDADELPPPVQQPTQQQQKKPEDVSIVRAVQSVASVARTDTHPKVRSPSSSASQSQDASVGSPAASPSASPHESTASLPQLSAHVSTVPIITAGQSARSQPCQRIALASSSPQSHQNHSQSRSQNHAEPVQSSPMVQTKALVQNSARDKASPRGPNQNTSTSTASRIKPVTTIQKRRPPNVSSAAPPRPSSGTRSAASYALTPGSMQGKPAPLSHTKLCRDRLNGMFERLRTTLPAAPNGVEVKHKAQVLDYAISVLKKMVRRTSELEIELAVSSNRATMDWVSNLVARADTFSEAAAEVMRVFSRRRHWRLAELWLARRQPSTHVPASPKGPIRLVFGQAVTNDTEGLVTPTGENIQNFSHSSEHFKFAPDEGVQGRVWSSMRPEWLAGLTDVKTFARASLALRFGIKTCLAVPITITGKIEAVMCFYDTKHRPYDNQCVDLALRLTWALGNATGGKRAQGTIFATCAGDSK